MCDLWKNTTTTTVPVGAIPAQISTALSELSPARHIKLYNSGNFFDPKAIPPQDYTAIAQLMSPFQTVIVENHPRLVGPRCFEFARMLDGQLEVAMGLETVHPAILPLLNKQMSLADFANSAAALAEAGIRLRTFVLLQPPYMPPAESVHWAVESCRFAFDNGVECITIVPTRGGNGAMEDLTSDGWFQPPSLAALETALQHALELERGRVFVDLWDIEKLFDCQACGPARRDRLHRMNLTQQIESPVHCSQCST